MSSVTHAQPRRKSFPNLGPDRLFGVLAPAPAPPAPEPAPATAKARKVPVPFSAAWIDEDGMVAAICGKLYAIEPCDVDPASGVETLYAITSEEGNTYHVADHRDQPSTCDCGDFTFRCADHDLLGCKHIKALVALDLLLNDHGRLAAEALAAEADAAGDTWTRADERAEVLANYRKGVGL